MNAVIALLRWKARQESAAAWTNYSEFDRYVYAANTLNELADKLEADNGSTV